MTDQKPLGVVSHADNVIRKTDYLYRISLKCLVRNEIGEVLVVKETGRSWWDLPGGGMDHGEDIKAALGREMKEEVNFEGDFTYKVIGVEEPGYLSALGFWQLRLIFAVTPSNISFSAGEDGDEVAFMDALVFENSESKAERRIYRYNNISQRD